MSFIPLHAVADRVVRDPVHALSVDIFSEPAQRNRRRWRDSAGDPQDYCASLIETCELQQATSIADSIAEGRKHYQGDLGHLGPRILRELCRRVEYKKGVADTAISQLVEALGARKDAIINGIEKLVLFGYVERQRRSMATGLPKMFGVPQRLQVSSLTAFPASLRDRWRAVFEKKLADRRFKRVQHNKDRASGGSDRAPKADRKGERECAPAKLNPAGARRVMECVAAAEDTRHDEEQRALAYINANLPELTATINNSTG